MQQCNSVSYHRSIHRICVSHPQILGSFATILVNQCIIIFLFFDSYDLNELSGKEYTVESTDKQIYKFGICTDVKASCGVEVGACLTTGGQKTSMGKISTDLFLSLEEKSDSPYLLYTSGSVCGALSKEWTTKIEFVCQTDGMQAGPKIVEDSNCILIIHFATKHVCKNEVRIKCTHNATLEPTQGCSKIKRNSLNRLSVVG